MNSGVNENNVLYLRVKEGLGGEIKEQCSR